MNDIDLYGQCIFIMIDLGTIFFASIMIRKLPEYEIV